MDLFVLAAPEIHFRDERLPVELGEHLAEEAAIRQGQREGPHRPVWLLDEPYTALDAGGRAMLDRFISFHLVANGAVITSMHDAAGFPVTHEVTL